MAETEVLTTLQQLKIKHAEFLQQKEQASMSFNQLHGAVVAMEMMIKLEEDRITAEKDKGDAEKDKGDAENGSSDN